MTFEYRIGPSLGVARLGNSRESFYLEPVRLAGRPVECDARGNMVWENGSPKPVVSYKDKDGAIRRQAALFRVFRLGGADAAGEELTLDHPEVESLEWTVHLANKKSAWYNYAELYGNLLYGESNSYEAKDVPRRNEEVTDQAERRRLIIDPGPRTVDRPGARARFDADSVPKGYRFASFPPPAAYGERITSLGDMMMEDAGRLIVLGGFGSSGGNKVITHYGGADTWHDDISDGPVRCRLSLKNGETIELQAWCLVGSPKFVPEIANIVTLADTMEDVGVRHFALKPDMFSEGRYQTSFRPNLERDIRPILERPGAYRWVAAVPAMNSLSPPPFDPRDLSEAAAPLRRAYLAHFREPSPEGSISPSSNELFNGEGFPMMPLNSGSNSVSNDVIDKFLTLTQTQYFCLSQWAEGKADLSPAPPVDAPTALTQASLGNCVGAPMCPGIEVTWTTRNPRLYERPFEIRHRHSLDRYFETGLDPSRDETAQGDGCEPGDLTKRMAIPWQADFFQCSFQQVNFADPTVNKVKGEPAPPTYFSYWWPPQSPWFVLTGDLSIEDQAAAGTSAGETVVFTRGISTFTQMIVSWPYVGFVVNQAASTYRETFPYFAEQERTHAAFKPAVRGQMGKVVGGPSVKFANTWEPVEEPAAPAVAFETARERGRIAYEDQERGAIEFED